jgi:hypothetical protein
VPTLVELRSTGFSRASPRYCFFLEETGFAFTDDSWTRCRNARIQSAEPPVCCYPELIYVSGDLRKSALPSPNWTSPWRSSNSNGPSFFRFRTAGLHAEHAVRVREVAKLRLEGCHKNFGRAGAIRAGLFVRPQVRRLFPTCSKSQGPGFLDISVGDHLIILGVSTGKSEMQRHLSSPRC